MIGEVIGAYKITAQLGKGGMGLVYAGEHTLLGKRAAIKVLLPEYSKDPSVIERFFNEAKATTRVRHPGLVDIYDFGYHKDGSAFIVMELLEGESLATRLRRQKRLREPTIVEIMRQVASAIGAAHDANIIHRDLKPDNVFLVPDAMVGAGFRAKVLDFGVAKLIGAENMQVTRTGAVLGTPMYMSPEQCRGQGNIDKRSDLYSLGCMVFEMAAGRPPYVGAGTGDVLAAHIYEPVPPLDPAELSAPLGELVARMMAKKPEERPPSMQAVIEALDEIAGQLPQGTLAGIGPRPPSAQGMQMLPMIPAPPSQADLEHLRTNTQLDAVRPSTTLGQSVGEVSLVHTQPPARTPRSILAAAVVAGVVIGVGAVAVLRGAHKPDAPMPAAPAPIVTAPSSAPTTPSAPPPAPAKVKLTIEGPSGAEVFRGDGSRVGAVPAVDELAAHKGDVAYVVKLKGYADARVSLPGDADGTITATLQKKKRREEQKNGDAIVDPFAN